MYHTIEFAVAFTVDLEISRKHPLERLRIQEGTQVRAQLKPYVIESEEGIREVADLFFEDGTATRAVSFDSFRFVD